jgi:sugar lactone lactonase YvrE
MILRLVAVPLASMLLLSAAARASSPTAWEMTSYSDFLSGRLSGVSLTADGRLTPAPKLETVFDTEQPIIWSVVQAPDGALYVATGHRGRVYRADPAGKASLLWQADQPEVFALALDSKGVLYAGTSPDGKIYRIENGKAEVYFNPDAKYIWALAFGRDGALYAGTGDNGRVYRITAAGKGDIYYETGQSHVTSLAFDSQGRLLAGSEPNGILYRITARDKAFALYDADLPEIRAIVPLPDGSIYVAALGGSLSRRPLGGVRPTRSVPAGASVGTASATVTVEAQGGIEVQPKSATPKPAATTAIPQVTPTVEISGVEKSAIYRISPDNTVETLWISKEENVYDLVVSDGRIVFATDGQGRIYRLAPSGGATLVTETNEGEVTRLLETSSGLIAAAGDTGKLFRLGAQPAATGSFEAPVHDASSAALWGKLSWQGDFPNGSRIAFRTRSGNSFRPDSTWSDWSAPLTDPQGSPITSPNARYVQWKAEFTGGATLDAVSLAYLPQNTPPVVRSVSVTTQLTVAAAKTTTQTQSTSAYSITVSDTGDSSSTASSGTPTQNLTRPGAQQLQISWQAEDPDGDRLVYSVYFRPEGEHQWLKLKSELTDNTYAIDADSFADGKYLFRVVASDNPANPPATAREDEAVSSPTLIDQTPPAVTISAPRRSGAQAEVAVEAVDATSPLRRAEYSLDAGQWVPMAPTEGILDSRRESFVIHLDKLSPGEHLLVVRALDSASNAGLAKMILH